MEHAARYTAQQPASEPLRAVGARRAICLGGGAEVPPAAVFHYYIQLALFVYSVHVYTNKRFAEHPRFKRLS
jgi:hypothetical protein